MPLNGKVRIGLYRKRAPLNYAIVLEDTGEDSRIVHVSKLKPCYPLAVEIPELNADIKVKRESQKISNHFSAEEEYKRSNDGEMQTELDKIERQRLLNMFAEESEEEEFLGF